LILFNLSHAEENKGKTCAVFCHAGTIMALAVIVHGEDNFWRFLPDHASITRLEWQENG
jgi:broad specificity phosphatase PhoE